MNAMTVDNLKTFACTMAALAVTALFSWSFVDSTSMVRWGVGVTAAALAAASGSDGGTAGGGSAVLLD